MKLGRKLCLLFLLAALLLPVISATAAVRTVLLEAFTQWNCGPCAAWNPTERLVLEAMTRDTVISIKYHVWWPTPNNDAFYLWNTTEAAARTNYYGVQGVPDGYLDGVTQITRAQTTFRNQIRTRRNVVAPCTIELIANTSGATSIAFNGTITAESDMTAANLKLFAVLITDRKSYASAPGANGERVFDNIFRDLWPGTQGEPVSITAGNTLDFSGTLNKDAAWEPDSLSVIVFVQNTSTDQVLQAAYCEVSQLYGIDLDTEEPRQRITAASGEVTYTLELSSTGTNEELFHVSLSSPFPAGWTHTIEAEGVPVHTDSIDVTIAGQSSTTLTVRINPNNNPGSVVFDVVARAEHLANFPREATFRLMSGLDILVVDDDGGSAYGDVESYYTAALDNVEQERVWGWWDLQQSALDQPTLESIPLLIWATGRCANGSTLTTEEQAMLVSYLDNGGKLFLSGQGIAFDIRNSDFLYNYLHVYHVMPYAGGRHILGVENDITNGLDFNIWGGDGANNQSRQNIVRIGDAYAEPILHFEGVPGDSAAGVRAMTEDYAVVFFSFGFEAINTAAARDTTMARVLAWLFNPTGTEPERPDGLPLEFALGQNYPNPFNPATVIPYSLPEPSAVTLRIFDVLGREVAVLASGLQAAGHHTIEWNAADVPSGLYFYRLEAVSGATEHRAIRKLMLLK